MEDNLPPSSPPRRRFVPEPVETTRSSKRAHRDSGVPQTHTPGVARGAEQRIVAGLETPQSAARARRFIPQPIGESTRSLRKPRVQHVEDTQEEASRELQDTVTTTPTVAIPDQPASDPPRRKFAPEPVETSTRTSRKKFAPEPVETSTRSSKDKQASNKGDHPASTRRKFLAEPVETSTTRRRREEPLLDEESLSEGELHALRSTSSSTSSSSRKFAPELLETARGSFKRDRGSSGTKRPDLAQSPPASTSPTRRKKEEPVDPHESRFSAAALLRRQHAEQRQHSFHVPDLPIIESDSSDETNPPSLSDSPSSSSLESEQVLVHRKQPDRDTYTDYVLRLAAKTAEKQLQDQAMAAYINERPHEPVDHFAISHDEEDVPLNGGRFSGLNGSDVRTFRRESAHDLSWEMQNMQKHHEQLEQMKRGFKEDTAGQSRFSAAALAARHHGLGGKKADKKEKDPELIRMRNAASPPMLGDDLIFPFSVSPKMTRCDVDQVPRPRTADNDEEPEAEGDVMLWSVNSTSSHQAGAGLWMGLCQRQEGPTKPPTPMRSGLQTPAYEAKNPFETATPGRGNMTPGKTRARPFAGIGFLSLTPPREKHLENDPFTASIDRKLNLEKEIDEQFPSHVITQIYNYLSLGYPTLAHPFDEELSKISRIPIEELRRDDYNTDAKGHVNAPEGDGVDEDAVMGGKCKRWEALRAYCKEWYKQSPQMADKGPADWGSNARLRRGSWNR